MDNVDFTNKKIRIQTPHSKLVLIEMGLDENKLYRISKKEYLSKLKNYFSEINNINQNTNNTPRKNKQKRIFR